ncbi:MAG: DUF5777 family beta-barrel protein [Cytophagales bacterium]|nr:DUF5777 family beta-barrel protein [Cytophagales bacterium]MDW8383959.1 DUF5777 family beta-barrel protein [Flammeovirgaceae bacterium]
MRIVLAFLFFANLSYAQDLMQILDVETDSSTWVSATFKNTRVINAHSIETIAQKHLEFRISHRFGSVNSGYYELWGLDQSQIRWGLEYGITDRLNIAIGRSSFQKVYDSYIKYKLFRQRTGAQSIPVTITLLSVATVQTLKVNSALYPNYAFRNRLAYVHQIIIARKFSERYSFQVSPTVLHRNGVREGEGKNTILSCVGAGRIKFSKRVALNAEYFYVFPNQLPNIYQNAFSIGFDIETGGHVFQLHFTNSRSMVEKGVIAETYGNWEKGDVFYGFNISRMFSFRKK